MTKPKPACSIPDCGKPSIARGWCSRHYTRWHRHGDPLATTTARREPRPADGEDRPDRDSPNRLTGQWVLNPRTLIREYQETN